MTPPRAAAGAKRTARTASATRKRASAAGSTQGKAASEESATSSPGPADAHSPMFWREVGRACIWIGTVAAAALVVLLVQSILFIIGAIVIAVMLDGGTRLLGRVLPINRGLRLAIVVIGVVAFVVWTFYLTGSQIAAQAAQLPTLVESQVERINAWLAARGVNLGLGDLRSAASQIMSSLGRVTAAISTAAGVISSLVMMIVLAIFLAVEPQVYSRGVAWFAPVSRRDEIHDLIERLGYTLRRLMAGRLLGMLVTGLFTGILLMIGGVPMATLLGLLTALLAFLPNIGAILSGALITLVGFSVDVQHGLYALGVYFAVQMVESYLITPTVARKTVDLPPALVLGAQILFGALFGIIGLALADPIVAMTKVTLEERAKARVKRPPEEA